MKLLSFFAPDASSNAYLIADQKKLLIDCGMRNLPIPKIDALLLTHCHFDHIANASAIQKKTGCEIWMSEAEAAFFEKNREEASASQFFGVDASLQFKISKRIRDGDILDLGETKLMVIVCPGHTPGGLCLYEPESKTLFSGDTVFASGYGRYDLMGGDASDLQRSIARLLRLDVQELYPGHGPALKEGVNEYLKSISI